jgi:hypothetical protein
MATLVVPRLAIPVWIIVVGLVGAFQPPATMTANILLLGVGGVVIPVIWLLAMLRRPRARCHRAGDIPR